MKTKKPKWLIVMEALEIGIPVQFPFDCQPMVMGEDVEGRSIICWEYNKSYKNEAKDPILIGVKR